MRAILIQLSQSRRLRLFSERTSLVQRLSRRFVAGNTMEEALRVAAEFNRQGIAVTLDVLGESVTSARQAREAAEAYHRLIDAITERKLVANVSLKLTQMGLDLSPALAEGIVAGLAGHAARVGSFVRVDMEGSAHTQQTLDMVWRLHSLPDLDGAIGTVLQAYLYRSEVDVDLMLSEGIRLRLCKGAYLESSAAAFPHKQEVDANYLHLAKRLLKSSVRHAIATHDERMIDAILRFVREEKIDPRSFEFQMLYGIRRDLEQSLNGQGYNVRVYLPFGREWFPYFMRRLAERPANLFFLLRNLFHQ